MTEDDSPLGLETPSLRADGLLLRPWRRDDIPRIVESSSDGQTLLYLPKLPSPYGPDEALAFLERAARDARNGDALTWCIADGATDQAVGNISIRDLRGGASRGEIGYWTHPGARGRGVTSRALRAVIRYAVRPVAEGGLGLRRVWLKAAASNPASQRVARSAGMTEVGRDRRAEVLRDGTVDDFVRFDILPEEVDRAGESGAPPKH